MHGLAIRSAYRHLAKDKVSGFLNILGLAAGLACSLLILLYVRDELSFDRFHRNYDNIFRIDWTSINNGQRATNATTPLALGQVIETDMPQVRFMARVYNRAGSMEFSSTEKKFQEQNVFFTDTGFFHIFTITPEQGDINEALASPNSVVITSMMAKKYFGMQDPLGRTLLYENSIPLKVTAIVKQVPVNSDLQFDFLISLETLYSVESRFIGNYLRTDWNYNPAFTFFLAKEGSQKDVLNRGLNAVLQKYGDERSKKLHVLSVCPLSDIHLYSASVSGNPSLKSVFYIYIFGAISILILGIAMVNYINLATARGSTREKEVVMRKVLGASRKTIVVQFLSESILTASPALVLSFVLVEFGIGFLNHLTGKQITLTGWMSLTNCLLFFSLFIICSVISALYPAFFISRFEPSTSLQGRSGPDSKGNLLRKSLVVFQFTISIVLVICAIVINQQLQWLRNKPLGFQKKQIVVVPLFGTGASSIGYAVDAALRQRMNSFSNELLKRSKIIGVTATSALPGQGIVRGLVIPEGFQDKDNIFFPWISVDYNFISTLKIQLVAGREFSKNTGTDHLSAFILNESAVRKLGWGSPEGAINKSIVRGDSKEGKRGKVIGVVKDFNFNTLDQPIQPLILDVNVARFIQFAVSVQADHIPETIEYIRRQWSAFFPERIFEYGFLDRQIDSLYSDQENLSSIIEFFSLAAILLSCFGLFSLTSLVCSQKTREIGIRKILGGSVESIVALLSFDFLKLVCMAFLIGAPLSWLITHQWLLNYAYRVSVPFWLYILAGFFMLLITIITVSYQTLHASMANPVDSIRKE